MSSALNTFDRVRIDPERKMQPMKILAPICLTVLILNFTSACGIVNPQAQVEQIQDFAYKLVWSPDDQWLAASGNSGLHLIDAKTYQQKAAFLETKNADVAFGSRFMAASDGETVRVWDLKNNQLLFEKKDVPINFQSVAISRDDKILVTGEQKHFRLWGLPDGGLIADIPVDGFVSNVAFTDENSLIVIIQYKAVIQKWDVKNKKLIHSFEISKDVIFFTLSGDATIMLVDYGESGFELWDVATGKPRHYYRQAAGAEGWTRLSADNHFATVWGYSIDDGRNSGMSVWDLSNDSRVREFGIPFVNGDGWRCGVLNSDGSVLAASNNEGYIYIYSVASGEKIGEIYLPIKFLSSP
jgi:WD40 repeat protein